MASPLHQPTGFYLTIDGRSACCGGERTFAISDLASIYKDRTVGDVLRLMRCSRACGGRVLAAWLETGADPQPGVRPWRVPLLGPEAHGQAMHSLIAAALVAILSAAGNQRMAALLPLPQSAQAQASFLKQGPVNVLSTERRLARKSIVAPKILLVFSGLAVEPRGVEPLTS